MHIRYRFSSIFLIVLALFLFLGVLMTNNAFADTAVVSTDILNVRAGPSTGYNIITQVGRGDRLAVLEKSGDWYSVSLASGQKGWLAGWLVNIEQSQAQAAPSTTPGTGTAVKVNGNYVNIRSGPGTGYSAITQVNSGVTFPVLGSSNGWYNIRLNSGGSGWIAGWLVTVITSPAPAPTTPAPATPAPAPSQSEPTVRKAVVTGSVVNVRGGPGTTNGVISQVFQGNSLTVLNQSDGWVRVILPNGNSGWIAGWLVSMQTAPVNPPATPPTPVNPPSTPAAPATPPDSGNTAGTGARGLSLNVSNAGDKTTAVVKASAPFNYSQSFLANPDRLVVDLKGIVPGDLAEATTVKSKTVSQIRTGHFQRNPDVTRVVFDLKGGALYDVSVSSDRKTLTVQLYIPDIQGSYAGKVIAVDAGHGGSDPGACGKLGTREKDINLDIAKRVKSLLEAKGAKVIMTRPGDPEVGLYQRTSLANSGKADIFVSIHMNANDNSSIGGTSTYVYSGAKTARVQESERLARYIQNELVKTLGLRDIGVKYANFAVLRTSDMPAVLCELAFISNIPEEKYMNTDGFKNTAAECIVQGIGRYFAEKRNA